MNARAAEGSQEADLLVGQSMAMIEVYKAIGRIAAHQLPALITVSPALENSWSRARYTSTVLGVDILFG